MATKESATAPTKVASNLGNKTAVSLGAGQQTVPAGSTLASTGALATGLLPMPGGDATTSLSPAPATPNTTTATLPGAAVTVNGAALAPPTGVNGGAVAVPQLTTVAAVATVAKAAVKLGAGKAGGTRDFFMDEFEKLGTANKLLEQSQHRMLAEMQAMRSENQEMKWGDFS